MKTQLMITQNAINDYTKAIKIDPKNSEAYNNRGVVYTKSNQYENAIMDHTKAVEIDSKNAVAYNNRGVVYTKSNQYENAINDYTKAIKIDPKNSVAYNNRGVVYTKSNQYENAIKDHTKAIELNPEDAEAYNNRGIAYYNIEQIDRSIKDFENSIRLYPGNSKAYRNLIKAELSKEGVRISWWDWWSLSTWRKSLRFVLLSIMVVSIVGGILSDLILSRPLGYSTVLLIGIIAFILLFPQINKFKAGSVELEMGEARTTAPMKM